MKRSAHVTLLFLGGFSSGFFTGCEPTVSEPEITPESYYANNHYVPGAGYYHAPFRSFFSLPYNQFDAGRRQYFYGGQWAPEPYQSIVNVSTPTPAAASAAEVGRTDVRRGGFGGTGSHHSIYA